jgi:hypothetical protein
MSNYHHNNNDGLIKNTALKDEISLLTRMNCLTLQRNLIMKTTSLPTVLLIYEP